MISATDISFATSTQYIFYDIISATDTSFATSTQYIFYAIISATETSFATSTHDIYFMLKFQQQTHQVRQHSIYFLL